MTYLYINIYYSQGTVTLSRALLVTLNIRAARSSRETCTSVTSDQGIAPVNPLGEHTLPLSCKSLQPSVFLFLVVLSMWSRMTAIVIVLQMSWNNTPSISQYARHSGVIPCSGSSANSIFCALNPNGVKYSKFHRLSVTPPCRIFSGIEAALQHVRQIYISPAVLYIQ
jgi:hypothetical protein